MTDRTVLVTGGAGFIGSYVVEVLLEKKVPVRVLDNLSVGRRENVPPDAEFLEGDILDPAALDSALNGVGAVIHLAARVAIRDSLEQFLPDARINLLGTLNLLGACARKKVERFLFASSMAVYGDSPEPMPVPESYPLSPLSPYGISKLAAEHYVRLLAPRFGIRSVILRYFNVYGPRQTFTPYVGVVTIFVRRLLQGLAPVIFGDGKQCRDFVHVRDVARATVMALESDADGEVFNVGTGVGTSVEQIASLLIARIRPGAVPIYEAPHPGEVRYSIADISRIRTLLGFRPQAVFAEQIPEIIEWNRDRQAAERNAATQQA